jgi:hypothetical protein
LLCNKKIQSTSEKNHVGSGRLAYWKLYALGIDENFRSKCDLQPVKKLCESRGNQFSTGETLDMNKQYELDESALKQEAKENSWWDVNDDGVRPETPSSEDLWSLAARAARVKRKYSN